VRKRGRTSRAILLVVVAFAGCMQRRLDATDAGGEMDHPSANAGTTGNTDAPEDDAGGAGGMGGGAGGEMGSGGVGGYGACSHGQDWAAGDSCQAGFTCSFYFHFSGPNEGYCGCVDGKLECCGTMGLSVGGRCSYAAGKQPPCPISPPANGTPCGPGANFCTYPFAAACDGKKWIVTTSTEPDAGSD
jgi:hypothetical protein